MRFTLHLDQAHRLAVVTFSGTVQGDTILNAMKALYEAGGWSPGFSVLWDYRAIAEAVFLPEDLTRIIGFGFANQARGGPGLDVNLVNRRNEVHVLASKAFVAYRRYQQGTLRVPHDAESVEDAATLLGLPLAVVEAALDAEQDGRASA